SHLQGYYSKSWTADLFHMEYTCDCRASVFCSRILKYSVLKLYKHYLGLSSAKPDVGTINATVIQVMVNLRPNVCQRQLV
ncbi:hypothetical protein NDU88_000263, partial [Pleurodeles waltl]